MIVSGGKYFDNPAGVASGIAFETNYGGKKRRIYLLPGPPAEFETVFNNGVLTDIINYSGKKTYTCGFLICGIGEVAVARTVEPLLADLPVETAYTAVSAGTKLFLTADDKEILDNAVKIAHSAFAGNALPPRAADLTQALLNDLLAKKLSFGCAESCTGGIIADSIVSLPGASEIFKGGIVSYANSVKNSLLNVPADILEQHGAVSAECAAAMAQGAIRALGCDCAVSTTGIAGPGGGTPEKPVGLVFIAAAVNDSICVEELHLRGNRQSIREKAAAAACRLLWKMLNHPESGKC
jgi:nicotinamide-nucleotide amidase